jgi:monoamine oxidase
MARTPLLRQLQNLAEQQNPLPRPSRRGFLKTAAASLAAPAALQAAIAPRVAIVGAGLAGLTCAYQLRQAGIAATVYEASGRAGGRCWTRRGDFAEGQIAEHGGELIDQSHTAIRQLAQSLGLTLDNLLQAEQNGAEPFYYFDDQPYTYDEATRDLKAVWQKIHSDVSAASYPTLYYQSTQRGRELDQMSILQWINESVPGGVYSKLGQLLDVAYNIEYGAESSDQSCLNLLYLLGYIGPGRLRIFGPSNEKYHVRGGNDQIGALLAHALAPRIRLGERLTAIRLMNDNTYRLTFGAGGRSTEVTADLVVLTLPFSILRTSVDFTRAGFRPLKLTAIRELGMGSNTKLNVQFRSRHWERLGWNGDSYSDRGYQVTWDVTRAQPGASGILVDYTGGNVSDSFKRGTPESRAAQFLDRIEPVMPGLKAQWNGLATLDYWPGNPYALGSYSYWRVGQYTKFAGVEGEPEGNCHFAGEHTSIDFQGYLNGAVDSGIRAAAEIAAKVGK